jgi:MFS family permease
MASDLRDRTSDLPVDLNEPPTRVRYGVLFFLCSMAMLLYIDRSCIGVAASAMQTELKIDKDKWSYVLIAFALSYSLFEVPTGHWGDKYGSRGVITRIVVFWSLFTALTGVVEGLLSLVLVRFLFGAGEAGAFPNAALVLTKWFPVQQRGRVRGMITTVSMLGAAAAPPVATFLLKSVGWRWMFGILGIVGAVWSAVFYWWFRDRPADHPGTNEAERRLIDPTDGATAAPTEHHEPIPWSVVVTSPNVWFLGTIMMVSATYFYLQFQWYPLYLKEARQVDDVSSAWMNMVVMLGGAAGCVLGGLLTDAVMNRTEERKWSRRLYGGGLLLLSSASVAVVPLTTSPWIATLGSSASLMFLQMSMPTWWTVVAEISGKHGASMWGLMNSMGGIGVMGSTKLIGWYLKRRETLQYTGRDVYDPLYLMMAGLFLVGVLLWLFIDPTRSVVERPATSEDESTVNHDELQG